MLLCPASVLGADVSVDGHYLGYNASTGYPYLEGSAMMIPLKATMENLGAIVSWDDNANSAKVQLNGITSYVQSNQSYLIVNGRKIPTSIPNTSPGGITYTEAIPLLESFGATAKQDGSYLAITSQHAAAAIYRLSIAPPIDGTTMWNYNTESANHFQSGNYSAAIPLIEAMLSAFVSGESDENCAVVYDRLAKCYAGTQQFDKAAACWDKAAHYWTHVDSGASEAAANRAISARSEVSLYLKTADSSKSQITNFGVRYEPAGGTVLGVFPEDPAIQYGNDSYANLVNKDAGIYLIYMTYGQALPRTKIDPVKASGDIVELALEPAGALSTVDTGGEYLQNLAKEMENYGCKFILRFANEMNDPTCAPWAGEPPADYIRTYRAVADIFRQYAPSVALLWAPNFFPANYADYYPGDAYVDYVGMSSYYYSNSYTGGDQGQWADVRRDGKSTLALAQQFDRLYALYGHKKPFMISEGAASRLDNITLQDMTDVAAAQLQSAYTYMPMRYPNLKFAVYYAHNKDAGFNSELSTSTALLNAYKTGIASNHYISSAAESNRIDMYYAPFYNLHGASAISNTPQQLCTYVKYVNDRAVAKVEYQINGHAVGSSNVAPYTVDCDFSAWAGLPITVRTNVYDQGGTLLLSKEFQAEVGGTSSQRFVDVHPYDWHYDYVMDLVDKGIINGKTANTFDPDGKITRAELAKILAVASGDDLAPYTDDGPFRDSNNHWAKANINWAFEAGVVNGKTENSFAPDDNITREELAAMLVRYADKVAAIELPETEPPLNFVDAAQIGAWAKEYVTAMQRAGIINGYQDSSGNYSFRPTASASRAEAAKMISTLLALN